MEEVERRTLSTELIIDKLETAAEIQAVGCNPFVETLTSPKFVVALRNKLTDLFKKNSNKDAPFFTLYIESEQEDFYQKLTDSNGTASYKGSYIDRKAKIFGVEQANYESSLIAEISNQVKQRSRIEGEPIDEGLLKFVKDNIFVKQLNLRLPYNAFLADDGTSVSIWFCPLSLNVPKLDSYIFLDSKIDGYKKITDEVTNFFKYLRTSDNDSKKAGFKENMGGGKFISSPNSELIEAYDEITDKRVAVFERNAFFTLEYKRASIWGFVFNRNGQLLLHQRSQTTFDNRGMWDKSVGGHVDLTDASTAETAKREFIEEVYTKDAEYSNYNDGKTEMIVDFGEWRRQLRSDESFVEAFAPFTGKDKHIIMFRAFVEGAKRALTVDRDSVRRITDKKTGKVTTMPTRFRSDVFFFITAEGEMDTEEQMNNTFKLSGVEDKNSKSAASAHRLVSIDELKREVFEADAKGKPEFTDDVVHIVKNYWGYLTEFSSFVKDAFERIEGFKN
jgi:hypothetical protein